MSDEEDPLVTKPFKFVTGKSPSDGPNALSLMRFVAGTLQSLPSTVPLKNSSKSQLEILVDVLSILALADQFVTVRLRC